MAHAAKPLVSDLALSGGQDLPGPWVLLRLAVPELLMIWAGSILISTLAWPVLGPSRQYASPAHEGDYSNGTCAETTMSGPRSCSEESDGAWRLSRYEAASWDRAFRSCRAGCLNCTNCAYISVSLVDGECSWFSACDLGRLKLRGKARFRTTLVRELDDSPDRQPLRQGSHFSLQHWPKGTIVQHRTSRGGSSADGSNAGHGSGNGGGGESAGRGNVQRRLRPLLRSEDTTGGGMLAAPVQLQCGHCGGVEEDDHGARCSNMTKGA